MIRISQHGTDGFGHQLHGLLSVMACHNLNKYYFDSQHFLTKNFSYDHISKNEALVMTSYLKEVVHLFSQNVPDLTPPKNIVHSHEIYRIPQNTSQETTHTLDNAYYFEKYFTKNEQDHIYQMIEKIKPYFNNKYLPPSRLLDNNVVFHVRMGDALRTSRKPEIEKQCEKVKLLASILSKKYPECHFYIHSDGNVSDLFKNIPEQKKTFYPKNTPLIQVLSDFIHAHIFVSGCSSLSIVSTFLATCPERKNIVCDGQMNPDKHSVDKNSVEISKFIDSLQYSESTP